jgi:hypothetical protein
MDMQTKKEQWIDDTMNSADKMRRVAISDELRNRLHAIPREIVVLETRIPLKAVWLAAASIALLITINITSINSSRRASVDTNQELYTDYFSYLDEI